jgi:hypothetical protein
MQTAKMETHTLEMKNGTYKADVPAVMAYRLT